jgi:hypothetical protein
MGVRCKLKEKKEEMGQKRKKKWARKEERKEK